MKVDIEIASLGGELVKRESEGIGYYTGEFDKSDGSPKAS